MVVVGGIRERKKVREGFGHRQNLFRRQSLDLFAKQDTAAHQHSGTAAAAAAAVGDISLLPATRTSGHTRHSNAFYRTPKAHRIAVCKHARTHHVVDD